LNGIVEFVRTLGAARLAAMGAVAAALIFFFLFVIARVSTPAMAPLFTELSLDDSGRIVRELETQGVPYEIRNDGATIMIPKDKVARARMRLAETGLPRGGNVGYEIFDRTDTLGTTSFVQNVNHVRALEGELSRTIRSIDRIAAARVHLVIPERQLFTRDRQEPSASIVLQVRGSLEMSQVRAIRHLVASAVRGLKAERISIVDERGQLLADGSADGTGVGISGMDERNTAFERKLKEQIDAIVTSVVGANRARVTVSAELDYTRVQQTSDSFDPEARVVRSTQTREEQSATASTQNNDGVTVSNEVPGNNQPRANPQQQNQQPRDNTRKTEEVVNYEITRTTRTETLEPGRVKRISVAVLVDGVYTKGTNNEVSYQPRAKEDIERITALVRSAIGFNEKRGDMIEVVNLRFAEPTLIAQTAGDTGFLSLLRFTTDDIMRSIEIGVMLILGLLVLLFVVRPLVRRVITPEEGSIAGSITTTATAGVTPALAAPGIAPQAAGAAAPPLAPNAPQAPLQRSDHPAARLIESAQIMGEAHQKSMQKVGELVQSNPQETVSVIRQWMNERTA
jgi:flagellar M-ring protein FliF